jgi:tetratricopeptide (TPR) repeat protein
MDASFGSVTAEFSKRAAQITIREVREDDSKRALCVGALTAGCPDAFVDFHRLATAEDGYGDDALTAEEAFELRIDIHADDYVAPEELPTEYARYVRDILVEAEKSEDPSTAVPAARGVLAEFFHEKRDHEKASYFHQKDLDAAVVVGDREAEVRATRRLAREREAQGAHTAAAAAFRRAAEIAEREAERTEPSAVLGGGVDDGASEVEEKNPHARVSFDVAARRSRADLARVLYASAKQHARANAIEMSEKALEACLVACEKAGASAESVLEATARHELGLSRHAAGDFTRAVELQTAYLRACEMAGDERGEGTARLARAAARRDAGDLAGAESDLLQFLAPEGAERYGRATRRRLGETATDPETSGPTTEGSESVVHAVLVSEEEELELLIAEAKGWCALGRMQSARGAAAEAAASHEHFFRLASVSKRRGLQHEARVCLGEARGAARLETLMEAVVERSRAPSERLMAWKSEGRSFFKA